MSRNSENRINFENKNGIPVEDLKFKNPEAYNYDAFAEAQREWNMYRGERFLGTVEIESSVEYARESFHEKMEAFQSMDEDDRFAATMEALLYRQMLKWNVDSQNPILEGEKREFMQSLNVFLRRHISLKQDAEQQDIADDYVPDEIDLSLRELVEENKKDVDLTGGYMSRTNDYLERCFNKKYHPYYSRISGNVVTPQKYAIG